MPTHAESLMRRSRRWTTPPAARGRGPFEGAEILAEVKGPLGVLLWQIVRDVSLCASLPEAERSSALAPGAADALAALLEAASPAPALRERLQTLVRLPSPDADGACDAVSHWAAAEDLPATAAAFAAARARLRPEDGRAAFAAGVAAAAAGDLSAGEAWHRRALALARQAHDRAAHGAVLDALASLSAQRADHAGRSRATAAETPSTLIGAGG